MPKSRKLNNISCLSCFANHLCLTRNLSAAEMLTIDHAILNMKELKKGEHAFFSGDKMSAIYSVYMGSCKQYLLTPEGEERIENFYLPGDLIGLESIPNGKHQYSLMALEDTKLCIIPTEELINIMHTSVAFTKRVLNIYSYRMQNDKQIANTTNASQRVTDILLNIFNRLSERYPNKKNFTLPMSQLDISNFLGMSHETVNRILRKFNKEKIITLSNKKIHIEDIERIKRFGSSMYTGQNHE